MGLYLFLFKTEYPNVVWDFCVLFFFSMGHSSTCSLCSLSEIDKTEEAVVMDKQVLSQLH